MVRRESSENYLETILILSQKNDSVRSIDIANEMSFSKPSISRAMRLLREAGHITTDKKGFISLTESGRAIAERTYERHRLLIKCLVAIGVPEDIAADDACRIEHYLSPESFEKLKTFYYNNLKE